MNTVKRFCLFKQFFQEITGKRVFPRMEYSGISLILSIERVSPEQSSSIDTKLWKSACRNHSFPYEKKQFHRAKFQHRYETLDKRVQESRIWQYIMQMPLATQLSGKWYLQRGCAIVFIDSRCFGCEPPVSPSPIKNCSYGIWILKLYVIFCAQCAVFFLNRS